MVGIFCINEKNSNFQDIKNLKKEIKTLISIHTLKENNMKIVLLALGIMILSSCHNNADKKKAIDQNLEQNHFTEWKTLVINEGDTIAYQSLTIEYLDYPFPEEFLYYAFIMANKYNYLQAYFDVYTCLTDIYNSNIEKIDNATANLAIEYLLKAYQKGHHQAKDIVESYSIVYDINKNKEEIIRIFRNNRLNK
jgi:hypothetical protein